MNNLTSADTTKKAHAIRKQLSEQFEVPCRYINFGDCLRAAKGGSTKSIRNTFGAKLGSSKDKVTKVLLTDPETPTVFTTDWFIDMVTKLGVSKSQASNILYDFKGIDKLVNVYGNWSIPADARPFPQPAFS